MRPSICPRWPALLLSLSLLPLAACGSRGGDDPATPDVAVAPRTTPAPAPSPSTANDADVDDVWSRDLDAINEHVRRSGLLGDVYFDYDDAGLSQTARDRLAANARFLSERPEFVVTIEGHCDERGTTEYNLALGERRAKAAADYLMSLGVAADRVKTVSYGKEVPLCQESTEDCWARNRRAHFAVTGKTE